MHQVFELDRVELARRSYFLVYLPSCSYGTPSAKGFLHYRYWTRRDGLIRPPANHVFLLSFPFLSVPPFSIFIFPILLLLLLLLFFGFHPPPHPCCVALRCVSWNRPPRILAPKDPRSIFFFPAAQAKAESQFARDPTQLSFVELLSFPPLDI